MNNFIEVLITIPFTEAQVNSLRNISPRLNITVQPGRKPEDISMEIWNRTEVLYTDRVLPPPAQVSNLNWVQFHSAGIDFAVDSPLIKMPGIVVTTLSGAAATQVAEYAVMMMLSFGHRLLELLASQARTEWPHDHWERFVPQELSGSTVGLVGYGSVGRQIARVLYPFGMTILAIKRDVMRPQDADYMQDGRGDPQGDYFQRLYPIQALSSMLKECDFIVDSLPLTPDTRNLINADVLSVVKPTAFLLDVGRGGIVDHVALIAALQEHRLAGAALDVFPEEPLQPTSPLWHMPNVIITPHLSGISPYYDDRAVALFAENLNRYLVGLPLYNRFDPQKGY
jgi:phosphoglycerate dehydrogenase-like enzyme